LTGGSRSSDEEKEKAKREEEVAKEAEEKAEQGKLRRYCCAYGKNGIKDSSSLLNNGNELVWSR